MTSVNDINGIINILKPTGMTSHDVVSSVRKILNIKKVGHAGTLDPNVAGVLVICVGKGTKFSEILMNGDKEYICELILGKNTDTQDSYGKVIEERIIPYFSMQKICDMLKKFEGEQLQIPPAYSAVKLNGKKLYEYARENIIVEKSGKTVNIKEIKLIKFQDNKLLMKVMCTKGTYMRTLCNDMGEYLGTLGHMGILVRTNAKGLKIEDAFTLDELKFLHGNNKINECLIPVDQIFSMEKITVDDKYYEKLLTGNEIYYDTSLLKSNEFFIYCKCALIGLGHKTKDNEVKINKLLMWKWVNKMINKYDASCVAIGNFDGIHIGHDTLIKKMITLSREKKQNSIIITFKYVKKDLRKSAYNLKYINSFNTRMLMLKSYDVTDIVEIELDDNISKYSPEQFIKNILIEKFNAKNIVVGYNFTFGYKAMGNINTLKEFENKYGYEVEEIPPVKFNGIAVSSTLVRNLLHEGKIHDANSLLIRKYTISIKDIDIDYNKNLGFVDNKSSIIIPLDGRYKVTIGNDEVDLTICTNKDGSIFTFNKKIKKNKDIVFINWYIKF